MPSQDHGSNLAIEKNQSSERAPPTAALHPRSSISRLDSLAHSTTATPPSGTVELIPSAATASSESAHRVGSNSEPAQSEGGTSTDAEPHVGASTPSSRAAPATAATAAPDSRMAPPQHGDGSPIVTTPQDLARQLAGFKVAPAAASSSSSSAPSPSPSPLPPALPTRRRSPVPEEDSTSECGKRKVAEEAEIEEEWHLKEIQWPPLPPTPSSAAGPATIGAPAPAGFTTDPSLKVKIICQNENGPCSLIALCNILILRNDLHIPPGRESVTYSYLSNRLADYFLSLDPLAPSSSTSSQFSLSSVLSILPQTRYGLNLNPRFDRIDGFSCSSSSGGDASSDSAPAAAGELALFALARIPLLHGWLADPSYGTETYDALLEVRDYDSALEAIVQGAEIAGGVDQLRSDGPRHGGSEDEDEDELLKQVERRSRWTEEQEAKVRKAHLLHSFLESTSTQLTYPGLASLCQSPALLPPSGLAALFRNSHLSVLYRRPTLPPPARSVGTSSSTPSLPGPELFTLVTDSSLGHEGEIVWESLGDVDGGGSEFFDAALRMARTRGGDWVGYKSKARSKGRESAAAVDVGPAVGAHETNDLALAQQLQAEEDAYTSAQLQHAERRQQRPDPSPVTSSRPPASTSSSQAQPQRTPPTAATAAGSTVGADLRAREREHRRLAKDKKGKGKDEKCLIM
ncbi:hypothetical protein JCM3774_004977 [Rhodotorula dairenensis]